jgi:hypothetical protein
VSTEFDPHEHRAAARLTQRYPNWLILWGTWSRRFWAYPLFRAPKGTILHAATAADLLTLMSQAEFAASGGARHPPRPPAEPPAHRPPGADTP